VFRKSIISLLAASALTAAIVPASAAEQFVFRYMGKGPKAAATTPEDTGPKQVALATRATFENGIVVQCAWTNIDEELIPLFQANVTGYAGKDAYLRSSPMFDGAYRITIFSEDRTDHPDPDPEWGIAEVYFPAGAGQPLGIGGDGIAACGDADSIGGPVTVHNMSSGTYAPGTWTKVTHVQVIGLEALPE